MRLLALPQGEERRFCLFLELPSIDNKTPVHHACHFIECGGIRAKCNFTKQRGKKPLKVFYPTEAAKDGQEPVLRLLLINFLLKNIILTMRRTHRSRACCVFTHTLRCFGQSVDNCEYLTRKIQHYTKKILQLSSWCHNIHFLPCFLGSGRSFP